MRSSLYYVCSMKSRFFASNANRRLAYKTVFAVGRSIFLFVAVTLRSSMIWYFIFLFVVSDRTVNLSISYELIALILLPHILLNELI